jgi:hypothetical protein
MAGHCGKRLGQYPDGGLSEDFPGFLSCLNYMKPQLRVIGLARPNL